MKKIPHPVLTDARKLTPMEMNNLHFRDADRHSSVSDRPPTPAKPG